MNYLSKIRQWWRDHRTKTHKRRVEIAATELYQLTEFQNALWLTYNGNLFCPAHFFGDEGNAVALVNTLRELYVERNTKTESEE